MRAISILLLGLLSDVLSTAAADEQVPAAFKNPRNWEFLIARTESRLQEAWKKRFEPKREGAQKQDASFGALELLADEGRAMYVFEQELRPGRGRGQPHQQAKQRYLDGPHGSDSPLVMRGVL